MVRVDRPALRPPLLPLHGWHQRRKVEGSTAHGQRGAALYVVRGRRQGKQVRGTQLCFPVIVECHRWQFHGGSVFLSFDVVLVG